MARAHTYEAVVLRSIDVGEADRFCIFFTRQRGRLAARARAVRKPQSRMGGSLLPFSHVQVDIAETENSATVTSAVSLTHHAVSHGEYATFEQLSRGAEVTLALTEDEEPLPKVFDLLLTFVHAAAVPGCDASLPFTVCLLDMLGLLPARDEDPRFARLGADAKAFVRRCIADPSVDTLCADVPETDALRVFVRQVLDDHLQRPLKTS
jgi:DNA repair protein RecO